MSDDTDKRMGLAFGAMSVLDGWRWEEINNRWEATEKTLINFAHQPTSADEILLTHWITYIANRQMKYERIWDIGGFVFSDLVHEFLKGEGVDSLLAVEAETANANSESFFRKGNIKELFGIKQAGDDDEEDTDAAKYYFISRCRVDDKSVNSSAKDRIEFRGGEAIKKVEKNKLSEKDNGRVVFASRFCQNDYCSVYFTLHTLKDCFGGSIIQFIAAVLNEISENAEPKALIPLLAYALHKLTYKDVKQTIIANQDENKKMSRKDISPLTNKIDFDALNKEYKKMWFYQKKTKDSISGDLRDDKQFAGMKRTWCALRDFLMHPEYKSLLQSELEKEEYKLDKAIVAKLFSPKAYQYLELPGDVWNNNSTFRKCLMGDEKATAKKTLGYVLRDYYSKKTDKCPGNGYPMQFDTTFSFAQRMCAAGTNCEYCVLNNAPGKIKENFEKICVADADKLCSVALFYCGYKIQCKGECSCGMRKLISDS